MALLEILKFPDSRLRMKSEEVQTFDEDLVKFSEDMVETMYSFQGIGLAAPQVNSRIRMIVVDTRPKDDEGRYNLEGMTELEKKLPQPMILVNPTVVETEGETTFDEGCLSLPSYFETVKRFDKIRVKAFSPTGEPIDFVTDGLVAICIQHEIDHLDGKLFIDRLSTIKANKIKNKIKKYGYPEREEQDETSEGDE